MELTTVLLIIAVLSLISGAYGGLVLLGSLAGRGKLSGF